MKNCQVPSLVLLACTALTSLSAATNSLPSSAALPLGSSTTRGFVVHTLQAPAEAVVANNLIRALKQIDGSLTDAAGVAVPNVAGAGSNPDGSYNVDTVNFEVTATGYDLSDADGNVIASFAPDLFPGIPGSDDGTGNFAVEVVGFLQLPAGVTTFGTVSSADRTDANDDDGFQVYVSTNPRDYFGTKVAATERSALIQPFVSDQHNETVWSVNAPVAGLYPFRIVHWQTGHTASLSLYTIGADGTRVVVNDPADETALKAFRDTSVAAAKGPFLAEAAPAAGSDGNSSAAPIEALIVDGSTTVATSGVSLYLNGTKVTPQTLTKAAGKITLSYAPNATRTDKNNLVRLEFADSTGAHYTNSWSFGILVSGASGTTVAGQWDFNSGDLSATVGKPLTYFAPLAQQETKFGTTTALGVADIGGKPAKVMEVPGDLDRRIGYVMDHGISPNGGGTKVNQYTLIMDVYVDTTGAGAASLLQIDSTSNTTDGDLFWQGNNFGQGTDGYKGRGTFTAGAWHRVIAAYDEAATPPVVTKFVDGIKQDDWTAGQGLDAARRALPPTAILFGDGDQDERRTMWVNSVQIRSGKITDAEAVAFGGPTAEGIPLIVPQSTATGQWDFDYADLLPSIGKPLTYFDPTFDGPAGSADDKTTFGTTTDFAIADIGGVPATVVKVPGTLDRRIGYVMDHGIKPNGGGTKVNQYTLIMDVYVDTTGAGAASLLQIDSTSNTTDGDLFWQGNNFGQGTDGYKGRGTFTAGEWHRVIAAYDEAATPPVVAKFVDGIKQDDWTTGQGLDAARRALLPTAILFGDGDQDERRTMYVNSIQIRAGRISDAEAVALGGPAATGIPAVIPQSTVTGQWDFDFADLGATVGTPLAYFDPTFDGPAGSADDKTTFGTTTELGIADIGGTPAKVIQVPGTLDRRIGYVMTHRIAPNGGGTKVNQYTLIFDIMVDTSGAGAASLLQIDSTSNTTDGDLFWQGNNFGQGTDGYKGDSSFTAGEWHRVIAAYDEAATPPVVTKFVDGVKQDDWTTGQGLDAARRALLPTAILFGDGDQDERRTMWVNSVQIRSGKLTDAQMVALGGPSAAGIPLVLPVVAPTLTVSTVIPPPLTGTPLTNVVIDTNAKTITADINGGSAGYLTITPVVTILSTKVTGGKLVVTYQ